MAMDKYKSKLILLSCVLSHCFMTTSNNWIKYTMRRNDILQWNITQGTAYLLYPLLGLIADFYISRYRMITASFVLLFIGSTLMLVPSALKLSYSPYSDTELLICHVLAILAVAVSITAVGIFEANAIQFGMQQLVGASSEQLSSFIHWYYWCLQIGPLITYSSAVLVFFYFSDCRMYVSPNGRFSENENFYIISWVLFFPSVIQTVFAFVGTLTIVYYKKIFCIQEKKFNPIKPMIKILQYSYKHTVPENRSAFTYWEPKIPARINFGKQKYGGPFTNEEVEDMKTFFRLLIVILSLFGFFLSYEGETTTTLVIQNEGCPPTSVLLSFILNPNNVSQIVILIGIPMYHFFLKKYFQKYIPNLLSSIGIGLFLCLIQHLLHILIGYLTVPGQNTQALHCGKQTELAFLNDTFSSNTLCLLANSKTVNTSTGMCDTMCHGLVVNSYRVYLPIILQIFEGVSSLMVFMTILEFICAQAPHTLKGLLIGLWYAMTSIQYMVNGIVENQGIKIGDKRQWTIYSGCKGLAVLISFVLYITVCKFYTYRERDEIVNEQAIIESQYERELLLENQEEASH